MKNTSVMFLILLATSVATNWAATQFKSDKHNMEKDSIRLEMQRVLINEFRLWYPLSIDPLYGGFFSDINYNWEVTGQQTKMIVTQARHVWSTANASMYYKDDTTLLPISRNGIEFLREKMWDKDFGGFYDLVTRRGDPIRENGKIVKRAYGNAFAVYGLAANFKASGDTAALSLAQETFRWLEKHCYDPQNGGYFQFTSREGVPFVDGCDGAPPKDQNSTIHLLEAFTELYSVWPDPVVKERLQSLLLLVRDRITTDKGYMVLFFKRDWTPISYRTSSADVRERNYEFDHVSFGHDIETAYLMLEASKVLGIKDNTRTLAVGKKMVDHSITFGWDKERGGIYDGGYYLPGEEKPTIVRNTKEWWSQVEALNSLLLMSELYPNDEHRYFEKFRAQWEYCKKYVIDTEHGGWYWGGIDIVPNNKFMPKSTIWKCNYHTSRALINCITMLN